jgi:hypothetical protein
MGELFDAIRSEAAKRPNVTSTETRLEAHLGKEGWKDFQKACLDRSFSTSVICRVVKSSGFNVSYSAIQRIRVDIQKQAEQ